MNPKRLDDIEVLETCDDSRPGSVVPTWSTTVSSSGYYSPTPDLEHEFLRSICVRQASMEQRLENIEAQGARQEQSQAALERSTRETNTLVKQLLDNHDNKAHVDRTFCDTLCQRLEKLESTISHCVQPSKLQEIRDDIHAICEKLKKTPTDGNWKELVQSLELEAEHLNLDVTILKVEYILHDLKRKLQASPSPLSPNRGQPPLTSPEEVDSVLQKLKEVKISEGRIKNSAEIEGNGNHSFLCGNHATFNFPVERSGRRSTGASAVRRRPTTRASSRALPEQRRDGHDHFNTAKGTDQLLVHGRMYGSATQDSHFFPRLSTSSAQHHAENRASPMKFWEDEQQDSTD